LILASEMKGRVVARITALVQQLQRESATLGPLVDALTTSLLDLVLDAAAREVECEDDGVLGAKSKPRDWAHQTLSFSNSPRLIWAVEQIQKLERSQAMLMTSSSKPSQKSAVNSPLKSSKTSLSSSELPKVELPPPITETQSVPAVAPAAAPSLGLREIKKKAAAVTGLHGVFSGKRISTASAAAATTTPSLASLCVPEENGDGEVALDEGELALRTREAVAEATAIAEAAHRTKVLELEASIAALNSQVMGLEQRTGVYRTLAPISEDEMLWIIESKGQNAYLIAEKNETDTQAK